MDEIGEVLIIPGQLRAARENLALPLGEVAGQLYVNPQDLADWEQGVSQPPVERLWQLADLYNRSVDYFLKDAAALPEQISFRLADRKEMGQIPLADRKILVRFDELCRAQSELDSILGKPRPILVKRVAKHMHPEELAKAERDRLSLKDRPIPDLRKVLTEQGVKVFEVPVPEDSFSGFSYWHQDYGPCILVNAHDLAGRRAFTLAHEYAHLLGSHPPSVCDLNLDVGEERFAKLFAASFLMPASHLRERFLRNVGPPGTRPSDQQIGILANLYRVSLQALGIRLEDLGLVSRGFTDSRIEEWKKRKSAGRGKKGPRWRHQLGESFVSTALEAHLEGLVSAAKLAEWLGQDIRTVVDVAEQARAAKA